MPRQQNIDTINQALAKLNAGDIEGYLTMYDRSVIFHGYGRHLRPGIVGLREHYTRLREGFPDMRIAMEDLIAEEEKICRRFVFYGSHKGPYLGFAPTMKFVSVPGQLIYHFKGGKCLEVWQTMDGMLFLSQIGAVRLLAPTIAAGTEHR